MGSHLLFGFVVLDQVKLSNMEDFLLLLNFLFLSHVWASVVDDNIERGVLLCFDKTNVIFILGLNTRLLFNIGLTNIRALSGEVLFTNLTRLYRVLTWESRDRVRD